MDPYTAIAPYYDYLLKHVDYEQWYNYISSLMLKYIKNPRTVLELGCGTGRFGAKFSADDFTVFGIDRSFNMLRIANLRAYKNFKIFCADMRKFCLAKKMDFIFSVHDTMNYFLNYRDIKKVLRSVRDAMHGDSIFMFDITTEYNIMTNFHQKVSTYKNRGVDIEWGNVFDKDRSLVYSTLKFKNEDGAEIVESHIQRIYTVEEMSRILTEENFRIIDIFGDYTCRYPGGETIMVNFITGKS